jgi:hypothetical protein
VNSALLLLCAQFEPQCEEAPCKEAGEPSPNGVAPQEGQPLVKLRRVKRWKAGLMLLERRGQQARLFVVRLEDRFAASRLR